MNRLKAPADRLVHETTGYVNAQIENVKLRSVKGLSQSTSTIAGLLLISAIASVLVMALSFAIILWLGERLGSYAQAAFIMSGVLLLVLVVLILLRKHLFKNSFVGMYTDIFYKEGSKPDALKTQEGLDMAIWNAESRIKEKEDDMSEAYAQCKEFYSLKRLLSEGMSKLGKRFSSTFHSIHSLFKKKR